MAVNVEPTTDAGHDTKEAAIGGSVIGRIATLILSGMSSQVGAAVGAQAFPAIGPKGVVALRQAVAAVVLVPLARPSIHRMTWAEWWPTLLLAAVFASMNLALFTAIERIGLGLAVTLEFLGPLGVALAGSRTRLHLLAAVSAAIGVYVLVLPGPSSDYLGVGLALFAGACWASYILLYRVVGIRLPGLQAPAVATSISALIYLPVLVTVGQGGWASRPVLYGLVAGLLCSVVPYTADLIVLRHLSTRVFGTFMSMQPVWAAVAGLVVLGQVLEPHEWMGIIVISVTNAVTVVTARDDEGHAILKEPDGATAEPSLPSQRGV